jgi:hypothetical protein
MIKRLLIAMMLMVLCGCGINIDFEYPLVVTEVRATNEWLYYFDSSSGKKEKVLSRKYIVVVNEKRQSAFILYRPVKCGDTLQLLLTSHNGAQGEILQ